MFYPTRHPISGLVLYNKNLLNCNSMRAESTVYSCHLSWRVTYSTLNMKAPSSCLQMCENRFLKFRALYKLCFHILGSYLLTHHLSHITALFFFMNVSAFPVSRKGEDRSFICFFFPSKSYLMMMIMTLFVVVVNNLFFLLVDL